MKKLCKLTVTAQDNSVTQYIYKGDTTKLTCLLYTSTRSPPSQWVADAPPRPHAADVSDIKAMLSEAATPLAVAGLIRKNRTIRNNASG